MSALHSIEFEKSGLSFRVDVVCFNEFCQFDDNWTGAEKHIGGVTVKNPEADRNSWVYFTPEFSLAERIEALIESGTPADQASGEAYRNAQRALRRDIHASDYGFSLFVSCGGATLLNGAPVGCSFDYSYLDTDTLEAAAEDVFSENGVKYECINLAMTEAQRVIESMSALQSFVSENKGA